MLGKSHGYLEAGQPPGRAEDPATEHALAVADLNLRGGGTDLSPSPDKELEAVFAGQVPGKITGQDIILRA